MSAIFEVYYRAPTSLTKESSLNEEVAQYGGRLTFHEATRDGGRVCLTYEFDDRQNAEIAASALRERGEHVEGPMDYGD